MPNNPNEIEVDVLSVVKYEEPDNLGGRPNSKRGWKEDKRKAQYDVPEALLERFAAFLSDEDYLSLQKEIALLRSMLDGMLSTVKMWEEQAQRQMEEGKTPQRPPVTYNQLLSAIDNVGKMVERQNRIVNSDVNTVTIESAMTFAIAVADVVNRYVKDPKALEAVFTAIRALLTSGHSFRLSLAVTKRILGSTPIVGEEEEDEGAGQ